MSWEAVTWANRQRLNKCYEQAVLLVLANCADPNGEAFVKWPGRDHWWMYLSDRTRLPKSSLFRHLNTLVALGLGERTIQVLADGTRRPTFKLRMDVTFDIDLPEDRERYDALFSKGSSESQSPVGTETDDGAEHDENDSDISNSQGGNSDATSQSPVGTENPESQSPVGTDPFPVLRLHKDSSLPCSKDSPLPPSGGLSAHDADWGKFVAAWRDPMPKMALARHAWDHVPTEKLGEAVTAASGYFAWLGKHPKPPATVSAQSFLRDVAGFAQWLRYAPDAQGVAPPITAGYPRNSDEGRALINLHDACGTGEGFRKIFVSDVVSFRNPITPQILAFADMPPREQWVAINHEGAGAWTRFARATSIIPIKRGFSERDAAPWIFPPSQTGKIYTGSGGPSDADLETLANEGR